MTKRGLSWLASYPKSGNTWFRVVLSAYLGSDETELDLNALQTGMIGSSRLWVDDVAGFDTADLTAPEIERLRPHAYRWSALHDGVAGYHKIHDAYLYNDAGEPIVDPVATLGAVYLLRNPLDVAPSFAAHLAVDIERAITLMANPDASLSRDGKGLNMQLVQRLGTWSSHVESWVNAAEISCHVLRYEDMHATPQQSFAAAFAALGLTVDHAKLARAISMAEFDKLAHLEQSAGFRERPSKAKKFFRSGKVGGWRHSLTPDQVARIIAEHGVVMQRMGYLDAQGQPI
ncbi:sulfotransferase domain-containing protein [Roseibaca sp. V10]|uniref:Sulfotransferase domain-containing protein n=1 Tax=Roseinatronobacter domitianus TaxID=2940293 RepID=A0ABT0M2W7_9RHOB|nr:sulfotransferase domain-containing protein [Roseibaca domitiana]MCL1629195.1 sulfotransferase domain-containing protein [Roseibaca domitiana]